jgi:hypothetical protein
MRNNHHENRYEFVFANPEKSRQILGRLDEFISTTSEFERKLRMKTNDAVSPREFSKFCAASALPWTRIEEERLNKILNLVVQKLRAYQFGFEEPVFFIKTNGLEESHTAYTRGHAVILSERRMQRKDWSLERLIIHELFHIFSRYHAQVRDQLYARIGFTYCGPIKLPAKYADQRVTNPDSPQNNHLLRLSSEGSQLNLLPVLYVAETIPDFSAVETHFDRVKFVFLAINETENVFKIDERHTNAYLAEELTALPRHIVHYAIPQPEEIMAEIFTSLVTEEKSLISNTIVEAVRLILSKK